MIVHIVDKYVDIDVENTDKDIYVCVARFVIERYSSDYCNVATSTGTKLLPTLLPLLSTDNRF